MKHLKSSTFIITIILAAIYFYSCSEDSPTGGSGIWNSLDTSTFTYPFTSGSTWSYKRTFSAENIRPDSIRHYFTDFPVNAYGDITIMDDTVLNGIPVKCFVEDYTEDTLHLRSRTYYGNYDTAMVCYGYISSGGGCSFPFRKQNGISFQKNNKSFNSLYRLSRYLQTGRDGSDTVIYIENPPLTVLKYPVKTNTRWLFKDITGLSLLYKNYLNFENIWFINRNISCIKIQRDWEIFNDDYFYDYISKFGQMKRNYLTKDMLVTTAQNPDGIGYVDLRDLYDVVSFYIVQP